MRRLVVVAMLLLAGCGDATRGAGDEEPALRPLDEPALARFVAELRGLSRALDDVGHSEENRRTARVLLGIVPAEDAAVRAVAEFRFGARGRLRLYAWRARGGRDCFWIGVDETGTRTPLEGGPFGPCIAVERCAELCVEQHYVESPRKATLVAGFVAATADELRLIPSRGPQMVYALDGPLVAGFAHWRAFAAHLGRRDYGEARLYAGGKLIEKRDAVEYDYETEDCIEEALREKRDETACF